LHYGNISTASPNVSYDLHKALSKDMPSLKELGQIMLEYLEAGLRNSISMSYL
jgi:hypothetical protein